MKSIGVMWSCEAVFESELLLEISAKPRELDLRLQ